MEQLISDLLLNTIYPIGTIMVRYDQIDPKTLPGLSSTKWSLIDTGDYVKTTNSITEVGKTGGSKETGKTVLDESQIPCHDHSISLETSENGSHTHPVYRYGACGEYSRGAFMSIVETKDERYHSETRGAGTHKHIIEGYTHATGDDEGHSHTINPRYIKLAFWKRTN